VRFSLSVVESEPRSSLGLVMILGKSASSKCTVNSRVAVRGISWLPTENTSAVPSRGKHGKGDIISRALGIDVWARCQDWVAVHDTLSAIAQPGEQPEDGVPARLMMCPYTFVGAPQIRGYHSDAGTRTGFYHAFRKWSPDEEK